MIRTDRTRTHGFSLVELLIALVFISFLMAGMLRIYGSAIQGFVAANETVKAQRDNRWSRMSRTTFRPPGSSSPTRPRLSNRASSAARKTP